MARGQVLNIPSNTGQLVTTLTREEKFSFALLNPNDGVCYIRLNEAAGLPPSMWDWKLPSQSYGLFPGPWKSVGIFYVDQSGSNRNADLNLYEVDQFLNVPQILAIGRASPQAGTAVDMSQG